MNMIADEAHERRRKSFQGSFYGKMRLPDAGDGELMLQASDAMIFNRVCGPLLAATADPTDASFAAQVLMSAEVVAIDASHSRQVRHVATSRAARQTFLTIIFSRRGTVSLRLGGTLHRLDVAIIGPDTDFTVLPDREGDSCLTGALVIRSLPQIAALLRGTVILSGAEPCQTDGDWRNGLRVVGERLLRSMDPTSDYADDDRVRDILFLEELIRSHIRTLVPAEDGTSIAGGRVIVPSCRRRDLVTAVQNYLRDHAGNTDVTPARLARHCAVSVRKLYNAFSEAGLSLRATVLSYRLEEARHQLHAQMATKVASIAHDAGFRDVSTFYRNFRREFGFAPRRCNDTGEPGGAVESSEFAPEATARARLNLSKVGSAPANTLFKMQPRRHKKPFSLLPTPARRP